VWGIQRADLPADLGRAAYQAPVADVVGDQEAVLPRRNPKESQPSSRSSSYPKLRPRNEVYGARSSPGPPRLRSRLRRPCGPGPPGSRPRRGRRLGGTDRTRVHPGPSPTTWVSSHAQSPPGAVLDPPAPGRCCFGKRGRPALLELPLTVAAGWFPAGAGFPYNWIYITPPWPRQCGGPDSELRLTGRRVPGQGRGALCPGACYNFLQRRATSFGDTPRN